jgi:sterol desaturase/sphingolipid hydroxylase (fatty acid hydroxylase superfamily)
MNRSISVFLLNISVALYLFATGILGLSGKSWFKEGEIRRAVTGIFKGDFAEILIVVLAILAIAAGVFILLKLFGIEIPLAEISLIVLAIVWLVFIILVDVIYPLNHRGANLVDWLRSIGSHLMALGGITLATERFGG